MSIRNSAEAHPRAPSHPLADRLPSWLRGRRGLILLGTLVLGFGAAFNWNWLVAAGVAPLLLSVLPCVAMCALGLCMNRMASSERKAPLSVSAEADAASASLAVPPSCCSSGHAAAPAAAR